MKESVGAYKKEFVWVCVRESSNACVRVCLKEGEREMEKERKRKEPRQTNE